MSGITGRFVKGGRATYNFMVGAYRVAVSPHANIPKTVLHPRMPPYPQTFGEIVRVCGWRSFWKHDGMFWSLSLGFLFTTFIYFVLLPNTPAVEHINPHKSHHRSKKNYGKAQKEQDKLYWELQEKQQLEAAAD